MSMRKDTRKRGKIEVVQQQFLADSNINNMIARVKRGATNPDGRKPIFGDFTYPDFQAAQNALADVEMHFQSLPARVRTMFSNRPENVVRFVNNPENRDQAIKLGLLVPEQSMDDIYAAFLDAREAELKPFVEDDDQDDPPTPKEPKTSPKKAQKKEPDGD